MAKGKRPRTQNQTQFYVQVGDNIRYFRERIGETQEETAYAVGLSRTALINIEHGRQALMLHWAVLLTEHLGCPLTDLCFVQKKVKRSIVVKQTA